MNYDATIYKVLAEAGNDGLPVAKISMHVLNACNSIFDPIEYEDVHAYVQRFLLRASKHRGDAIERMERRGYYRLNPSSVETRQLLMQFTDAPEPEESAPQKAEDLSLSLF